MAAIASRDFEYLIYLFDSNEMDKSKLQLFRKGDELPRAVVDRLEAYGPEDYLEFTEGKSKKVDIPEKLTEVKKPKYTEKELTDMNEKEQVKILKSLGVKDIPDKEKDRVKKILELT